MNKTDIFKTNIRKIVRDCCCLKAGEKVLIISDVEQEPEIYRELFDAVTELGGRPSIALIPVTPPGKELPDTVNEAAMEADLILTPTTTSIYHAPGLHHACMEGGARVLSLSECCMETFLEGGINADFKAIEPVVELLGGLYDRGKRITYSTPAGTQITADISGRQVYLNSGICRKSGEKIGLPTIEVFIAPVEDSVEGIIVVDASCSAGVGAIEEPIIIRVEGGKAVEITGGRQAEQLCGILEEAGTSAVYQIAELAIGLNPRCNITGKIVEDEGKYGTCHMALGSNASFGGLNPAPLHIDMVQFHPTIHIDGQEICRDGKLTVTALPQDML